jgi:hypothetical protein
MEIARGPKTVDGLQAAEGRKAVEDPPIVVVGGPRVAEEDHPVVDGPVMGATKAATIGITEVAEETGKETGPLATTIAGAEITTVPYPIIPIAPQTEASVSSETTVTAQKSVLDGATSGSIARMVNPRPGRLVPGWKCQAVRLRKPLRKRRVGLMSTATT